jgi:hypothetical protein
MSETRTFLLFLAADEVGFERFGSADEDRARVKFRWLRSGCRGLKRAGDGCHWP